MSACAVRWGTTDVTCGSAAARWLGLRVRIPPVGWMFIVSVVCCQVDVSATGRSPAQSSPIVCVCVIYCEQVQQ